MMLSIRLVLATLFFLFAGLADLFAQQSNLQLNDGERIVILGSEFVEQQIKHNYFESMLTQHAKTRFEFRNLGWAGDTPACASRGYFKGPTEGFARLKDELNRIQPTLAIVCYGANATPIKFEADLKNLLQLIQIHTSRIVVMSHPAAESLGPGFASPQMANEIRQANARLTKKVVQEIGLPQVKFLDLFALSLPLVEKPDAATHDTIRFKAAGYRALSLIMLDELGWVPRAKLRETQADDSKFEQLRQLASTKNQLYFHRYRPQNETYLRGFRKHEQGQNAKEIQEFDALIQRAEDRIWAYKAGRSLPDPVPDPAPIKLSFEAASPEKELATFNLAEGISAELFASEPLVANPIHMNFDSQGRLWVATSPIYPHIKPGAKPSDEILILEDTNGDGKADKRTVFADDLLIPTAVLPDEQGGAYVANSTELLHLQDTDGDGVADRRRVVLAGFGTEDTHHIIHTFRWGHDTSVYFNQSIYIHTHMETPHGVKRLMGSGIWRLEPQTVRANILMRGLVNPWGHVIDEWGQSFATDGAGGDGINFAFPGSAYPTAVGYSQVLRGLNPGQPKHCGLEQVGGSHFPPSWEGSLVTNDFRGNRINRFELVPNENGFVSRQLPDLLSSSHRAFRPVDVKLAPDGTLFVADWYNPIINHGEVDFRDSRRDYKHGRIWRLKFSKRPTVELVDFAKAKTARLVELACSTEPFQRIQAKIELKHRFPTESVETQAEVLRLLDQQLENGEPKTQLNAIWTLAALGEASHSRAAKLLKSPDPRVRAAGLRVATHQFVDRKKFREVAGPLAKDNSLLVRLEFINAWLKLFDPAQIEVLLPVLSGRNNQYVEFALANALKQTSADWVSKLSELGLEQEQLVFMLRNVNSPERTSLMLEFLQSNSENQLGLPFISILARQGSKKQVTELVDLATNSVELRKPILKELVRHRRGDIPVAAQKLERMWSEPDAVRLAGAWNVENLRPEIDKLVRAKQLSPRKIAAIQALGLLRDIKQLESIGRDEADLIARRVAIAELATVRAAKAMPLISDFFQAAAKEDRLEDARQLTRAILARRKMGQFFVKVVNENPPPAELLPTLIEATQGMGAEGRVARKALDLLVGKRKLKSDLSQEEINSLVARVNRDGNPVRGEAIYRRQSLSCIKCHAIGGAGGVVGPDMISLGASSPIDYIIESLLNPNAKIKEGYHTTTVLTIDGLQYSGKLMGQSDGQLILRDADDKRIAIELENVEQQKISRQSLMPADLTDKLTEVEFVDLVSFLSQLGKEGEFKVPAERLVRRWICESGEIRYGRVNGLLPSADIPGKFVTFEFEVSLAGTVGFEIENPNGLRITLDDMKDNLRARRIVKDLDVGKHSLTIEVGKARRDGLRIKLIEVSGSRAQVRLINQ